MKVVFPEPDGPTRKTNSPLSISTEQSRERDGRTLVRLGDVLELDHERATVAGRSRRSAVLSRFSFRINATRGRTVEWFSPSDLRRRTVPAPVGHRWSPGRSRVAPLSGPLRRSVGAAGAARPR